MATYFKQSEFHVTITKIVDGDTVDVDIDLGFGIWQKNERVRIMGIDTPELRGSERLDGLKAKQRLCELILGKQVAITTHKDKTGKYGRWLVTIWDLSNDGVWTNINDLLLSEGYAEVYGK